MCGQALVAAGVTPATVDLLSGNAVVAVGDKKGPAFDVFEEMDSTAAVQAILTLNK